MIMDKKSSIEKSKYVCKICDTVFTSQGTYWSHVNKKKNACITKERCLEFISEIQDKDNKIDYYEEQTKLQKDELLRKKNELIRKERENEELKKIVSKLSAKEKTLDELVTKISDSDGSIKNTLKTIVSKINSTDCTLGVIKHTLDEQKDNPAPVQNNILLNTCNTINSSGNKMVFDVGFTEKTNEKVNHITQDMMMEILNHSEYNDTLKHVAKAVYFHPLAPQNWKWCVNDKNARLGALEYNATSNTIIRKPARDVINTNLQNAVFQLTDVLGDLEKTNVQLNETQDRNRRKIFNSLGTDFTLDQLNNVKTVAYDGRNLVKALWESLFITLETSPISCKIKN